jgi:hypothetical protein
MSFGGVPQCLHFKSPFQTHFSRVIAYELGKLGLLDLREGFFMLPNFHCQERTFAPRIPGGGPQDNIARVLSNFALIWRSSALCRASILALQTGPRYFLN